MAEIRKIKYTEYRLIDPHESTCPKCEKIFFSDVPKPVTVCPYCQTPLIMEGFTNPAESTREVPVTNVYRKDGCMFNYCPNPDACQAHPNGCIHLYNG